jgi:hypothetical protein
MVIDHYLKHKDRYPFDDRQSAYDHMVELRRKYRKQHQTQINPIHHRVYVLRRETSYLICKNCNHCFKETDTNCCKNFEPIEKIEYIRVKKFH